MKAPVILPAACCGNLHLFAILSEKSKERFSNRKLEAANQKGVQAAWYEANSALRELQDIIKRHSTGIFILPTGGKLIFNSIPTPPNMKLED